MLVVREQYFHQALDALLKLPKSARRLFLSLALTVTSPCFTSGAPAAEVWP